MADNKLTVHFGHCSSFALLDVDTDHQSILGREDIAAPPHEPGLLPPWLAKRGTNLVIAGGMGQRAINLFLQQGIKVIVGASSETPEKLVSDYMAGILLSGINGCDH
jgi:predicted Fe-Mo cluster-binding NifX family protein